MKPKFLVLFLLVIGLFSFVGAVPPFRSTDTSVGIVIEAPVIITVQANELFKFHIHIYNATDAIILTNETSSCMIHVYNLTGAHLIEDNMSFDSNGIDFKYDALGGNFTVGQHAVLYDCQTNDGAIGGFFEYGFDVTNNGHPIPVSTPNFLMGIVFLIFLASCFFMYLSHEMNETAFKIFFILLSLIFLMATFITGYMGLVEYNVTENISTAMLGLVIVIGMILIIIFVYVLIRQTINALDLYRIKRGLGWNVGAGSSVGGYRTKSAY